MPGNQITSRVNLDTKIRFSEYAKSFGLSDSELAKLLILRERYQKQLQAAISCNEVSFATDDGNSSSRTAKITAHYPSTNEVQEFVDYVHACSNKLSRSSAAAWLMERELIEKWLPAALALPPVMQK